MGWSSICVLAVVVAAAGCKGGAPPEPAAQPPTAASAPRADKPSQPPQPVITKEMVDRYIDFETEHRKLTEDWLVANKGHVSLASGIFELDPKVVDLRKKWRFTEDEQRELDTLVTSIIMNRAQWNMMGKAQLAELDKPKKPSPPMPPLGPNATPTEKMFRENLEKLLKQGEEAEARGRKGLVAMRDLTDERTKYGSAIVDYVLSKDSDIVKTSYQAWMAGVYEKAKGASAAR